MIARFRDFIGTELKEPAYKPLRDILDLSLNKRVRPIEPSIVLFSTNPSMLD
jgi:hypothetical protein